MSGQRPKSEKGMSACGTMRPHTLKNRNKIEKMEHVKLFIYF